jgi:hypothetical protein
MDEIMKYFVIVIVIWRLTHLITTEDGPFDLIIKLRKSVGSSFLGKLMDCFYCLSIWIGLAFAWYLEKNNVEMIVILTLYYSGASILLEKLTNKTFV